MFCLQSKGQSMHFAQTNIHIPTLQSTTMLPHCSDFDKRNDMAILNMCLVEKIILSNQGIIYDEQETWAQCPGDYTAWIHKVIIAGRLGHENPSLLVWHLILCIRQSQNTSFTFLDMQGMKDFPIHTYIIIRIPSHARSGYKQVGFGWGGSGKRHFPK